MAQLTKMQQKIYDYIAQAIQDQGYPPSVREIGEAVGLKSPSTVHFHLKHLEELGHDVRSFTEYFLYYHTRAGISRGKP